MKNSWEAVEEETIIKSFKKCGVSNAMDGTEDEAVFEGSDNNSSDESNTNGDINEMSDSTESGDELNIANTTYFNNK
ncbi:hypothetical protein WH47_04246 [Habropoda laboriosa]|uniref:Uncharacterized protein n=1 Tax=Habropoda laboriosa TaxID=597456 RepID=A0A0L7QVD1_9HYME|nr:hypothetical protein WH47_04246 [Habropoda laboriosa]